MRYKLLRNWKAAFVPEASGPSPPVLSSRTPSRKRGGAEEKVRVLHVIESLGRGGAEQALVNLLPALREEGVDCEVAALWPPYDLAQALEDRGIPVHRLDVGRRASVLRGGNALARLIAIRGYQVVHAHMFFSSLYTAAASARASQPLRVTSFHNLAYDSNPANTVWGVIRKRLERAVLKYRMDGLTAVSAATARHYVAHQSLERIALVPNAFPVDELRDTAFRVPKAQIRARYGIADTTFLIVSPGRLVPEKDHRTLLHAAALGAEQGLPSEVLLIGGGPLESELSREANRLRGTVRVRLLPPLPHGDVLALVGGADLLVLASTTEAFGMVAAEAMALETPVIATHVGGLPDLIEDGVSGLLVPPHDPAALAAAIGRVMRDPTLGRLLGEAGRERITANFDVQLVAGRLAAFYRGLERARR